MVTNFKTIFQTVSKFQNGFVDKKLQVIFQKYGRWTVTQFYPKSSPTTFSVFSILSRPSPIPKRTRSIHFDP